MARKMGGLDPKYWTRWRYFKTVQWPDIKQIARELGMILVAVVIILWAIFIAVPKVLFLEWKEKRWPNTKQ